MRKDLPYNLDGWGIEPKNRKSPSLCTNAWAPFLDKSFFKPNFDVPKGERKILTTEDGFPWSDIEVDLFTNLGLQLCDIDRQEVNHILSFGQTEMYPSLDSLQSLFLGKIFRMGIYLNDNPLGFAQRRIYSTFQSAYPKGAELDLLHICPNQRGKGYGSLLFDLSTLRLLTENPNIFTVRVSDKTGKIEYLLKQRGFTFDGIIKETSEPRFKKPLYSKESRERLKDLITNKIRQRLENRN